MQSQEWKDRDQVKKGCVGEQIIINLLEGKGYVVYTPITKKAHAFDMLAVKNKKVFRIAEVKSYPRMLYFEATGINENHYKEYLYIMESTGIPILIFFIDEYDKCIYLANLDKLKEEKVIFDNTRNKDITFPFLLDSKNGQKRLFHLSQLLKLKELNEEEIIELKKYTTRNILYKYD
jgi:hypothetical protein